MQLQPDATCSSTSICGPHFRFQPQFYCGWSLLRSRRTRNTIELLTRSNNQFQNYESFNHIRTALFVYHGVSCDRFWGHTHSPRTSRFSCARVHVLLQFDLVVLCTRTLSNFFFFFKFSKQFLNICPGVFKQSRVF